MMNLKNLYDLQIDLDETIKENHNLKNANLANNKILALFVEVGELANETRCFKFWSLKEPSEKNIILEEFVDCLHFILSIGIELNFFNIKFDELEIKESHTSLTNSFLDFYDSISKLNISKSLKNYKEVFSRFILLGKNLNFTPIEIEDAYLQKNKINHQRQEDGY